MNRETSLRDTCPIRNENRFNNIENEFLLSESAAKQTVPGHNKLCVIKINSSWLVVIWIMNYILHDRVKPYVGIYGYLLLKNGWIIFWTDYFKWFIEMTRTHLLRMSKFNQWYATYMWRYSIQEARGEQRECQNRLMRLTNRAVIEVYLFYYYTLSKITFHPSFWTWKASSFKAEEAEKCKLDPDIHKPHTQLTWCSHYSGFLLSPRHCSVDVVQNPFNDAAVACCPRKWEYLMRSQATRLGQMFEYRWEHCPTLFYKVVSSTWNNFIKATRFQFSLSSKVTLKLIILLCIHHWFLLFGLISFIVAELDFLSLLLLLLLTCYCYICMHIQWEEILVFICMNDCPLFYQSFPSQPVILS